MPFESLPSRLGPIPVQPVPHFNVPPVAPIGEIIQHGAKQVADILDTFNPLNQAERQAKIELATMQTYAAQQARQGNWEPFMKLHGHFQNMQLENLKLRKMQNELEIQGISIGEYKKRQSVWDKLTGTQDSQVYGIKPPKMTEPNVGKQIEDTTKKASGVTPTPWRPDDPVVKRVPLAIGDQASSDPEDYQYPEVSPEDYYG